MFHFSNFAQKIKYEQRQLQKVSVTLPEFYLFVLCLFLVLGESYFKAAKVRLDEYFDFLLSLSKN